MDTATAQKNSRFILSGRAEFRIVIPYLSCRYIDIDFSRCDITTKVSEMVYYFRRLLFNDVMAPSC